MTVQSDPDRGEPAPSWVERTWGGDRIRAEPVVLPWVERAMESHTSLYAGARADHDVEMAGGRGPVYGVRSGEHAWMVRHYRRGGALGDLLDDRYLAVRTPRPFREQAAAHTLRLAGVPTPAVLAAAVYPSGALYRGDLVTERVQGAVPLLQRLAASFTRPEREEELLVRVGRLARMIAEAGALHVDFNAGNVLVTGDRVWVIDLDRCRLGIRRDGDHADQAARRMLDRLERSIRKTVTGGEPVPAVWLAGIAAGPS